ncbi:hypothetical protein [Gracilibacillus xinjiangensis]|uniref:Uncharacterized protein n=1 Tax=Gracilibacillus xinjiangensis TaxID=1193282 RepID=A0ABV8WW62_9BACI
MESSYLLLFIALIFLVIIVLLYQKIWKEERPQSSKVRFGQ